MALGHIEFLKESRNTNDIMHRFDIKPRFKIKRCSKVKNDYNFNYRLFSRTQALIYIQSIINNQEYIIKAAIEL